METIYIKEDKRIVCITARSFPSGISDAFYTLENLHPSICERPFYGIVFEQRPGKTIYKAGVEEQYKGEGDSFGCETFVISKGQYLGETIHNYMLRTDHIPNAFQKLLADPRLDSEFPCLEWYKNDKEVICLVKMKQDNRLN